MPLHQAEPRAERARSELVIVDQSGQDYPGQLGQSDRRQVVDKMSLPLDHQVVVAEHVTQFDRPPAAGRAGQPEAELIDGEAQIFDLVIVEPQAPSQAGGRDPSQAKKLRQGRNHQQYFVARSHDLRTVAACPASGWPGSGPGRGQARGSVGAGPNGREQ